MFLKRQVFLEGETAQCARRNVAGDLRGFDGNRATAAAGVVERQQIVVALRPAAGGQHGSGQRFLQWCLAHVLAPAALEQRLARGVDVERAGVGGEVGVNTRIGPLGVDVGAHAVGLGPEAVTHRVLDLEGGEVQAGQRTVLRGHFDLDGFTRGEPDFPGHLAGSAVQVFLTAVLGVRQLHQHTLGQAAVQVQAHGVAPRAACQHAAPAGEQVLAAQAGQAVHFRGQVVLDASGAGQKQLQCIHGEYPDRRVKAPCVNWWARS